MKELNELAYRARGYLRTKADDKPEQINVSCAKVLAIAEAFRALEQEVQKNLEGALAWQQRAEAAEARAANLNDGWLNAISERDEARAKLAELEKQEPVAFTEECEIKNMQATGLYLRGFPDNSSGRNIELFTSPAPAINLAELVPDGWKLVPVEPSWEMISAAIKHHEGDAFLPVSLYKTMLAAAPTPHE